VNGLQILPRISGVSWPHAIICQERHLELSRETVSRSYRPLAHLDATGSYGRIADLTGLKSLQPDGLQCKCSNHRVLLKHREQS